MCDSLITWNICCAVVFSSFSLKVIEFGSFCTSGMCVTIFTLCELSW